MNDQAFREKTCFKSLITLLIQARMKFVTSSQKCNSLVDSKTDEICRPSYYQGMVGPDLK